MRQYIDLTIVFGARNPDGSYALSVRSPYGDANGSCRLPNVAEHSRALATRLGLPSGTPLYEELAGRLENFRIDEAGLTLLGQLLFAALFEDQQVRTIYDRTRGVVENGDDKRARIRLELPDNSDAAIEVGGLPWEFLFDPDLGPLALLDFSVVRYPIVALGQTPLKVELPLKVLLTAAVTPPPTEIAAELAAIREGLKQLGERVVITEEPHLTSQILQRRLREGFHVWHFVGHGAVRSDGQSVLVLEAPGSAPEDLANPFPVSALQLQVLLNRSGVRLIVLDACETSRLVNKPFDSLAPALIRAQASAVISMQFSVRDQTTIEFAKEFYKALSEGLPIDACVNEGRKAVMGVIDLGQPDWGIPTVYARIADGRLFEFPSSAPPTAATSTQGQGGISLEISGATITGSTITAGNTIKDSTIILGADSTAVIPAPTQITLRDGSLINPVHGYQVEIDSDYREALSHKTELLNLQNERINDLRNAVLSSSGNEKIVMSSEIRKLERDIFQQTKERVELRFGRLEFLRRPAAIIRPDELRIATYDYLTDAIDLKSQERKQVQVDIKHSVSAMERGMLEREEKEITAMIQRLVEERARLGL